MSIVSPPQSGSPQRRRWPSHAIVTALVIIATVGLIVFAGSRAFRPTTTVIVRPALMAPGATSVPVANVDAPNAPRSTVTVQAPGWLEAEPYVTACTALTDGVIAELLVLEGDRVEKGQIVARLITEDATLFLARAEAELASAHAAHRAAQADLAAANADWENPIERTRAVASTLAALAETEAELTRLPSLVLEQQATLERLREELRRARQALANQAATDIEVIILEKQADAQAAATEALRATEGVLKARRDRLRSEATAAAHSADLRIDERRAMDMATAAELRAQSSVALATAIRDEAALRLDRTQIRAPISGFVQRRLKIPGDKVMLAMDDPRSAHIIHLYDPERLQVRVDVPLADAANIYEGQRCEVTVDVLPDRPFAGEVLRITHEADIQKNTLQVKVRIIDPSPMLRPEMLARIKFLPATPSAPKSGAPNAATSAVGTTLVHIDCLDRSPGGMGARVWIVRDRRGDIGALDPMPVRILNIDEPWATVESALRPGDLLATPSETLVAGRRVLMRPPSTPSGDRS